MVKRYYYADSMTSEDGNVILGSASFAAQGDNIEVLAFDSPRSEESVSRRIAEHILKQNGETIDFVICPYEKLKDKLGGERISRVDRSTGKVKEYMLLKSTFYDTMIKKSVEESIISILRERR